MEKEETPKTSSGKGWKISTIILLIILIAAGSFATMIILKGDRDTNKLSEVEQQLKEKEAKIAELEGKLSEEKTDAITVDLDKLKTFAAKEMGDNLSIDDITFSDPIIMTQGEQKNIVVGVSVVSVGSELGFGAYYIYYKENNPTAEWKLLKYYHQLPCESVSASEAKIMEGLFYCFDSNGNMKPVGL